MAIITTPVSWKTVLGFRGLLDFSCIRGTNYVRMWPRRSSRPWTEGQLAAQRNMAQAMVTMKASTERWKTPSISQFSYSTQSAEDTMRGVFLGMQAGRDFRYDPPPGEQPTPLHLLNPLTKFNKNVAVYPPLQKKNYPGITPADGYDNYKCMDPAYFDALRRDPGWPRWTIPKYTWQVKNILGYSPYSVTFLIDVIPKPPYDTNGVVWIIQRKSGGDTKLVKRRSALRRLYYKGTHTTAIMGRPIRYGAEKGGACLPIWYQVPVLPNAECFSSAGQFDDKVYLSLMAQDLPATLYQCWPWNNARPWMLVAPPRVLKWDRQAVIE